MASRVLTLFLLAFTALGQNTIAWLESTASLPSLAPVSTRTYVVTGTEATGLSLWKWNATATDSTNTSVVKYTGSTAGRWFLSPYTGSITNATLVGVTTFRGESLADTIDGLASDLTTTSNALQTAISAISTDGFVGIDVTNDFTGILDVTDGTIRNTDFSSGIGIWDDSGNLNLASVDPDKLEFLNSVAINVATVAAMRSLHTTATLNEGQVIITAGRNAPNDGGSAKFVWTSASTTTTNLGTVFDKSTGGAGRYLWTGETPLAPAMFGMVGIEGVGQNLISPADSQMSAADTLGGTNHWFAYTNNFAAADLSTTAGKLRLTLRATDSGAQTVLLEGSYIRSPGVGITPGRYLVKLKARKVSGTAVQWFIGKSRVDVGAQMTFTPTGTEATYNGYFESLDTSRGLYLGLYTSADSNGSVYEFDSIECYFVGGSTLTAVPDPDSASNEGTAFQAMLDSAKGVPGRFEFPANRIYRVDNGGYVAWDGAIFRLNNSMLNFYGIDATNGLRFTSYGTIKGGKLRFRYDSEANDRGGLQFGASQAEAGAVGMSLIEDNVFDDEHLSSSTNSTTILIFGSQNASLRNCVFIDNDYARRPVNVVWSSAPSSFTGTFPAINTLIENCYFGRSEQNFPAVGGGGCIGVNGIVNLIVRNTYSSRAGNSLVVISPGDYWDNYYAPPLLNSGLANLLIENNSCPDARHLVRVNGTPYNDGVPVPFNLVIRNNSSVGGLRGSGEEAHKDAGILIEPDVARIAILNNSLRGHSVGILVTNVQAEVGTGFNRDLTIDGNVIEDSEREGILVKGLADSWITRNTIRNSGAGNEPVGLRAAISLEGYTTNVVITGNIIGEIGETTTNQIIGISVADSTSNHRNTVGDNLILGAAASGTPESYGASATWAIKGKNYKGTGITKVDTADKLSVFAATTSAELAGVLSNETGSGQAVFNGDPEFSNDVTIGATGSFKFSGRTRFDSSGDGQLAFRNAASSSGAALRIGTLDLNNDTGTTLEGAAGVLSVEGVAINNQDQTHPTTTALSYSGTNVTLTASSRQTYNRTLTLTNHCLLSISTTDGANGTLTLKPDASSSYTVYLDSGIRMQGVAASGSFVVTNSSTETVVIAWQAMLRGASAFTAATKGTFP